jgi:hypothetical protein
MEDYQKRVVEERDQLAEKIANLDKFTMSSVFDSLDLAERSRLETQLKIMHEYNSVLTSRIDSF